MIQQFQPIQYNVGQNQLAQLGQGIGQLGDAYQDRQYRKGMGDVTDTKSLLELYTMHPDKYDPNRVAQMQAQEEQVLDDAFMQKLESAENQTQALSIIKSDPKRYTKQIQSFVETLPTPEKARLQKELLEEGAYVNTKNFDKLPELFDARESAINNSNLDPATKADMLEDIEEDRKFLAAGPEIFAERHRLSEEGVLGAEAFEKLMTGRKTRTEEGEITKDSEADRAQTKAETKLKVQQAALAKAQAEGLPKEIAIAEDKVALQKLQLEATTKATNADLMGFNNKATAADFVKTQHALELNSQAAISAAALAKRVGLDDFGGTPELWKESFVTFFKGQDEPTRDVLRKDMRQLALQTAFALKQAGAMSDSEQNLYISTVPDQDASAEVWSEWLETQQEKSQQAYGALSIKRAFYDEFKDMKKADKDRTLTINGKQLKVPKGRYINDIIHGMGMSASKYAPQINKSGDLGAPNLTVPAGTSGATTGNLTPSGMNILGTFNPATGKIE